MWVLGRVEGVGFIEFRFHASGFIGVRGINFCSYISLELLAIMLRLSFIPNPAQELNLHCHNKVNTVDHTVIPSYGHRDDVS